MQKHLRFQPKYFETYFYIVISILLPFKREISKISKYLKKDYLNFKFKIFYKIMKQGMIIYNTCVTVFSRKCWMKF